MFGSVAFHRSFRHALAAVGALFAEASFAQSDYATPYTFTTLAGACPGSADGTGIGGRFDFSVLPGSGAGLPITPFFLSGIGASCLAADSSGNIYVADIFNDVIRKISPTGVVTTLAGAPGQTGTSDGTGAAARFCQPEGVAVDNNGNVYVGDTGNYTVRKISRSGVVTTLAGTPGVFNADGHDGLFDSPTGLAVDFAGNVYVADTGNNAIYKITPVGAAAVLAGDTDEFGLGGYSDGTGSAAQFKGPYGISLDSAGNVYVADTGNDVIRKITPSGAATTLAGTAGQGGSADGSGSAAQFNGPTALAADGMGNLYVADSVNGTIREITAAGAVTTLAGKAGVIGDANGVGAAARFFDPIGVAVDPSGNIFIADSDAIKKISPSGAVTAFAGASAYGSSDGVGAAAQFYEPTGMAVDGMGNIYVTDTLNDAVRKITPDGTVTTLAGLSAQSGGQVGTDSTGEFGNPTGLAIDGLGNIYVADTGHNTILKLTSAGLITILAGAEGSSGSLDGAGAVARFFGPGGVATDGSGNIYVADTYNDTIRKVTPTGMVTTLAGAAGQEGSADGVGAAARFSLPQGVSVDGAGNVYVADTGNGTIRKITPDDDVTTLAGIPGEFGNKDGPGNAARLSACYGLTVDISGNVFVADTFNRTIRKISPTGFVTTLAGNQNQTGSADGTGSAALFDLPWGIAVDGVGNVYVSDSSDNLIRKGTLATPPSISTQPQGQVVNIGSTLVLSGGAQGASGYQWEFNGRPISDSATGIISDIITGSTETQLVIANATAASSGTYTLVATNSIGSSASNAAVLIVAAFSNPGCLINLSGRGFVGSGNSVLIGGFFIVGSTSRTVLVQALGPALSSEGVSGVLQHPALTIHDSTGATIYSNTGWGSNPVLLNAAAAAYANPVLQPNSGDSEVLLTLPPGGYTAEISGADGGSGVALCAIYQLP